MMNHSAIKSRAERVKEMLLELSSNAPGQHLPELKRGVLSFVERRKAPRPIWETYYPGIHKTLPPKQRGVYAA
jgi:hypothetical protein